MSDDHCPRCGRLGEFPGSAIEGESHLDERGRQVTIFYPHHGRVLLSFWAGGISCDDCVTDHERQSFLDEMACRAEWSV